MKLRKNEEYIEICDICFKTRNPFKIDKLPFTVTRNKIRMCGQCYRSNLEELGFTTPEKPGPIKRIKWYITLHKYQKEGYEYLGH